MIKICFLSSLKEIVGSDEIHVDYCGSLSTLLDGLCDRYGERFCRLLRDPESQGRRSPFVKILVNGDDIKERDPALTGDETIVVFLPVAGG